MSESHQLCKLRLTLLAIRMPCVDDIAAAMKAKALQHIGEPICCMEGRDELQCRPFVAMLSEAALFFAQAVEQSI